MSWPRRPAPCGLRSARRSVSRAQRTDLLLELLLGWYCPCAAAAAISGLHRVRQLPPTASEELPTTPISVIAAVEPMTPAHHLGGTPHTADLPQGR
jgi:hypothetical protein